MTPPLADLGTDLLEVLHKSGTSIAAAILAGVASFVAGRWWGRYRASRQWHSKDFTGRIIVSLNYFRNNRLKIRTVFEKSLEEVFLNPLAVEKVQAAVKKTTAADPMLPVPKDDRWYLLNFVLNAVAEQFAAGTIREDAGQPVTPVVYAICLTCEVVGDERIRKVRAMMVRKDLLENLPYTDTMPELENPWHDVRVQTLRRMAAVYRADPTQFLTVELCV